MDWTRLFAPDVSRIQLKNYINVTYGLWRRELSDLLIMRIVVHGRLVAA